MNYLSFTVTIIMFLVFQQATCALDRDFCKAYDKDKAACERAGCEMRPYARYGLVRMFSYLHYVYHMREITSFISIIAMYGCLAPHQA